MRRERRTSWQVTAKSSSLKGAKRKSGGCAWKAVKLTSGGLSSVPESRLRGSRGPLTKRQKSAEGIVTASVWRAGHSSERRETASACRNRDNREGPNGPREGLKGAASKARIS
jgi:hypothetical protein